MKTVMYSMILLLFYLSCHKLVVAPDIPIEAVAQTTLIQGKQEIYAVGYIPMIPTIETEMPTYGKGFSERDPSKAILVAPDLKSFRST